MTVFSKKIIFFSLVCFSLSIIFYFISYNQTSTLIEESFSTQLEIKHENLNNSINNFQFKQSNFLNSLVNHPYIKDYLSGKGDKKLKTLFKTFAKADHLIMQIRIIDIKGNELLRLDNVSQKYIFKNKNELQNKVHRDYFKKFILLKKNKIGITKINLNIENNQIQKPFKSTVRVAMPIFIDNQRKAILVINYSLNEYMENLFYSTVFNKYLVDKNDFFIFHPEKNLRWSEFIDNKIKASKYFKNKAKKNLSSKRISLWGTEYKIYYEGKKTSSLNNFLKESEKIGFYLFLASVFLLIPSIIIVLKYIKSINRLNNKLIESKTKIELILNNTSDSIILIDSKGSIKELNQVTEKYFGYNKNELLGKNIKVLVPEPHKSKHDDYLEKHDRKMHTKIINKDRELYSLHKDGSLIPISLTVTKVQISNKEHFIGTIKNLSKEQSSKKLFENIFNSSSIGIALVLKDGSFWRTNNKFAQIVEYTAEELIQLSFQDITHPDDLEKDLSFVYQILDKEIDEYSIEKRYISKSGKIIWIALSVKGIFTDKGKKHFDYFIASIQDITEEISIRDKLTEAEKIAHIGHWLWNIENNTLTWSKNMINIFGKTEKTFYNDYNSFIETVHKEDRERVNNCVQETLEKKSIFDIEYRIIVNEKIRFIHAKGKVSYSNNKPIEFFGTCQDTTELMKSKDEEKKRDMILMQQSKLASMGEMVASIAHQWRQPLNSIGFIVQDMISAYNHNEFNKNYLLEVKKEMMEQLNFMSDTIDQFRSYFKKDDPYKEFNVINCVFEVKQLYKAQLKNNFLALDILVNNKSLDELSDKESFMLINQESQLKQVLINCISNSKDAILTLENPIEKQKIITIEIKEKNGFIDIYINDLAGGIDNKSVARIFEPFYTTKEEGTGLGLYICKIICTESLRSKITYKKKTVKIKDINYTGSCFIISLPKEI